MNTDFDEWIGLIEILCDFAYLVGADAARQGLDRRLVYELGFNDPMIHQAWESGYDSEIC